MPVRIGPSLMCCDLARVADEVARMEADGADFLHVDVMDGRFVPNIALGVDFVGSVARVSDLPQEVHLMVEDPTGLIAPLAEAGAALCTFHIEPVPAALRLIDAIAAAGMKPGIAVKPATDLDSIVPLLDAIDQVLVMTVEPGFAGQRMLAGSIDRVAEVAAMVRGSGRTIDIKADGGLTPAKSRDLVAAGATSIVAGTSSVFSDHRYRPGSIGELRSGLQS